MELSSKKLYALRNSAAFLTRKCICFTLSPNWVCSITRVIITDVLLMLEESPIIFMRASRPDQTEYLMPQLYTYGI